MSDLALRTVRPTRGDLLVTKLLALRWVAAAGPQLAREIGTLRAWADAPWVGWGERLSHIGPARWLQGQRVEPVLRSDSLRVQLAALSSNIGVGLVPEPSVEHYGLVPVKFGASLRDSAALWPSDDLFLVTHRALRDVPRVHAVWELLVRKLGERARGRASALARRR